MSQPPSPPPRDGGVRLEWQDLPPGVRAELEQRLGAPVLSAVTQPTGFSPGVAARLVLAGGRRAFVKAVCPRPNPDTPAMHRREAEIVRVLPAAAPVPRLLFSYDEGPDGWIALAFEDIAGCHPRQPWQPGELARVLAALAELAALLTPSPVPPALVGTAGEALGSRFNGWARLRDEPGGGRERLDPWSARHLNELVELERAAGSAAAGETLLHFDVRADNLLLTPERVWLVDWPLACVGAAWLDVVLFAPSVTMQGGPPPEQIIAAFAPCRAADPAAVTAVIACLAGLFTHRALRPPPPGLPTLRPFQDAQGRVTRQWLAERTGMT